MSTFAFNVTTYGEIRPISPVISQGRVRIFYKGLNRNRTYITDEFAEKLLSTLPYTPIVGKYEGGDFTDHGHNGEQLQVYGVVPENPNVAWETHLDYDGVEREYACADVLLWTGRFPEGKTILDKGQSMEIYDKSVDGQWVYEDGKKFYKFKEGCFLGLTALGDRTEPCFEGAAFYAYADSLKELIKELNTYNQNNGGKTEMDIKFKLSDSQKQEAIFRLINPNLEEGYLESVVCDVYDDYALCYNYETGSYMRAYYIKDDATDSVEITKQVEAYVLDVTKTEYEILQRLNDISNNDYALIEQEITAYRESQQDPKPPVDNSLDGEGGEGPDGKPGEPEGNPEGNPQGQEPDGEPKGDLEPTDFSLEIEKLNTQISELQTEISTYKLENEKLSQQVTDLTEYQVTEEAAKKQAVLDKYSHKLPAEIVESFKAKIEDFTLEEFEKEIKVQVLDSNEDALFKKQADQILPNDTFTAEEHYSGAEKMLANFLKKKNN